MTTLLIDNYDSYTYNVFHLLAAVSGEEPIVVHNDMVSWKALSRWDFDAIVISPGPGHPRRWHDFGVCSDVLRQADVPVLGVCLGHQGLGHVLDATVDSAPLVMHGRKSSVRHDDSGLFKGIPQGFSVVRYHSLAVGGDLGPDGHVTAWTEDGVVMGIEHRRRPMWGVQFHPESIATEHGHQLFENFYEIARAHRIARGASARRPRKPPDPPSRPALQRRAGRAVELHTRLLQGEAPGELLFERLFADAEHAFWLDSVDAPSALARSSFLGTSAGTDRCILEYDVAERCVRRHDSAGTTSSAGSSIFDVLDEEIASRALDPTQLNLPEGLLAGFVGYLGYECKADCGSPNAHRSDVPDAVMMLANRVVAIDHIAHTTILAAFSSGEQTAIEAESWLDEAERVALEALSQAHLSPPPSMAESPPNEHVSFSCGRGREQYLSDIARCQAELSAGESYEICLTDQIHTDVSPDPWELYRLLRRRNPAPFAAYLKLGEVAVVSSSPERFLSVDRDRVIQARPIKGTASRSSDPSQDEAQRQMLLNDEKTFAEHLMIVDLLRNDLGRVSELDSVRVPQFMVVESYPTVHQLISTITGVLDESRTPVECVRACFPGGSMTGAPKLRTMGIIDDIEREARGVYSGAIGYFGLEGAVDLSIVIRTIVMRPGATTIGAGGAIVMQSDPEEEFEEILLKARAPMSTIAEAVTGSSEQDAWTVDLEHNPVAARMG
jgi:para-aminobenzoate synthetase